MVVILIVAHAPLASALAAVAAHSYPECGATLVAHDITRDEGPDDVDKRVRQSLRDIDDAGALILTDVVGATPHMGAWRVAEGNARVRLVSGVNVPMLWRTLCYRAESLDQLASRAADGGKRGVVMTAPALPSDPGSDTAHHAQDPHLD